MNDQKKNKRILILGGTGMLGHVLFRSLSAKKPYIVRATVRDQKSIPLSFPKYLSINMFAGIEAHDLMALTRCLREFQPAVVINCIGLIKQLPSASDPLSSIALNALFPHQVAAICREIGARLVQISTDCVFDGKKGMYKESDVSNATDLYGRTKYLGEVTYSHCLTLRTSIIGHELKSKYGLIEWFLNQQDQAKGYTGAIYSGFPTIELASIIDKYALQREDLHGLYHVSSEPINKFELLKLVAQQYYKKINLKPNSDFVQDRSMDSSCFRAAVGYKPPSWPNLIKMMYNDYKENRKLYEII